MDRTLHSLAPQQGFHSCLCENLKKLIVAISTEEQLHHKTQGRTSLTLSRIACIHSTFSASLSAKTMKDFWAEPI